MADASATDAGAARDHAWLFCQQRVTIPAHEVGAVELYERLRDVEHILYSLTLVPEHHVFDVEALQLPAMELQHIRKAFGLLIRYDDD
jgi:hypothetical protein